MELAFAVLFAVAFFNVLIAIALSRLFLHIRGRLMQAKFTITFTENAAVPPIQLATTQFTGTVGTPETGSLGPSGGNDGPFTVTVDPTTPLHRATSAARPPQPELAR